jgi:hypothetical protein
MDYLELSRIFSRANYSWENLICLLESDMSDQHNEGKLVKFRNE